MQIWIYIAALAVCGAARILLVMRFTDYDTGFYTQNSGIVWVFNLVYAAVIIVLFLACRLRKVTNEYPVHHQSKAAAVLAVLVGVAIAMSVLVDDPYPFMEQGYSEKIIQARAVAGLILGVLAALSFIVFGICALTGNMPQFVSLLALMGCIWQVVTLVFRFNSYTTLTTIPNHLLAVLFMIFAALFMMGHARTVFGFSRKSGRNYTIPSGLCVSLTGFLLVIPNYLAASVKDIDMPFQLMSPWESVYILLLSVYALVFVVGMIRSIKIV